MSDKTTTVETSTEPTPVETPITTEVPNAADVSTEESGGTDANEETKKVESR